ncbi:MAG: hypothetical protein KOO65_08510 [Desulfobacterales bacterium]|nr:hypothetical protein [Desulfobacterales bacterium]
MNYKLAFNEQELNIIIKALGEMPYKFSAQVLDKIQKVINESLAESLAEATTESSEG